jgi:hypothetical protein
MKKTKSQIVQDYLRKIVNGNVLNSPSWVKDDEDSFNPAMFFFSGVNEDTGDVIIFKHEINGDADDFGVEIENCIYNLAASGAMLATSGNIRPIEFAALVSESRCIENGVMSKSLMAVMSGPDGEPHITSVIYRQLFDENDGVVPALEEVDFDVKDKSQLWAEYDNKKVPDPLESFWDIYKSVSSSVSKGVDDVRESPQLSTAIKSMLTRWNMVQIDAK